MWFKLNFLLFLIALASASPKVNSEDEINLNELCDNKEPNEFFRLNADSECREVFQCSEIGLLPLRCPSGLVFDIEKQTCDWRVNVNNCKQLEKIKFSLPTFATENPICDTDKLACGSKECIAKEKFCDGIVHCPDGSDESLCDIKHDPNSAPFCDEKTCKLPECYCSENGTSIPNNLPRESVPQMIMITFDDAVNNNNIHIYNEIFKDDRLNPNNCSIKGTFFLSHKYSNYSAVQNLHRKGHEIAVHSITHNSNEKYWSNGTIEQWTKEMVGARKIFEKFANITDGSVLGLRAPLLKIGGNNQFQMMQNNGFLYDSSMTVPLNKKPIWPYTLHNRIPHKCYGNFQKCPTRSASVWEIAMNEYDRTLDGDYELTGCAMVDQCTNLVTGDLLYTFLNKNFNRHYKSNKAPLGLYFHASWLLNRRFLKSLTKWIDEKLQIPDVYFVTMTQVIRYMQNTPILKDINNFEPWKIKCNVQGPPACYHPNQCALTNPRELPGETVRLHTCMECSRYYPWINNPSGDFIPH